MEIKSIFDQSFKPFGRVLTDLDATELIETLQKSTDQPSDGVIYIPSDEQLESLPAARILEQSVFGGMTVQIGYCNGSNTRLNCLEYHRSSEINILADSVVFLVAPLQAMERCTLSTDKVQAFHAPAGAVVELYATTMHYAPCNVRKNCGFRVAVVLPRGTNTECKTGKEREEDSMLRMKNKWLISHVEAPETADGAYAGLTGENIDIAEAIE